MRGIRGVDGGYVACGAAFAAGILSTFQLTFWTGGVWIAVGILSLFFFLSGIHRIRPSARITLLVLIAFLLGAARAGSVEERAIWPDMPDRTSVWLEGELISPVLDRVSPVEALRGDRALPYGWKTVVSVDQLESLRGDSMAADAHVRLSGYGDRPEAACGDRIRVLATVRTGGGAEIQEILDAMGWSAFATAGNNERIERIGAASGSMGWIHRLRSRIASWIDRRFPTESASTLKALLIADRSSIDEERAETFRRGGVYHFFSVSGLHVGLVAGVAWVLFAWFGTVGWPRALCVILLVWAFSALTAFHVPVVRAATTMSILVAGELFGRVSRPLCSLSVAAVLVLAIDPMQIGRVGFQYTFASVFAILTISPVIRNFLAGPMDPLDRWVQRTRLQTAERTLRFYMRETIAISLGVWLLTAPLSMWHFHQLTPAILIGNLLLYPFVVAVLLLGLLAIVTSALPVLGMGAAILLESAVTAMDGVARISADVPGAVVQVPDLNPAWLTAYGVGILLVFFVRRVPPKVVVGIGTACLAGLLPLIALGAPTPEQSVTVLDVGQGSAAVVQDGRRTIVWDCGSSSLPDPAKSVIAPYLWSQGVRQIDRLILTHSDTDHVSGVPFLVRRFAIGAVIVPPQFGRGRTDRLLRQWLADHGIEIRVRRSGDQDGPHWRYVNPTASGRLRDNDTSLAVVWTPGSRTVFLTGDMEARGWREAGRRGLPNEIDFMLVPHHGSANALPKGFLDPGRVRSAVVSARAGFTPARVIDAYVASGVEVMQTSVDGSVRWSAVEARVESLGD